MGKFLGLFNRGEYVLTGKTHIDIEKMRFGEEMKEFLLRVSGLLSSYTKMDID